MKTIIAVGLYRPGTGFTRVFLSLIGCLCHRYKIHWVGIGYKGPVVDMGYTLHPNNLAGGDIYGSRKVAELAVERKADFVWILNDIYMLHNYKATLEPLKSNGIKLVAYTPLDGYLVEDFQALEGAFLNSWVLYADWAKREIVQHLPINSGPDFRVIGHGIDLKNFRPQENRSLILKNRKRWFAAIPKDALIILNANRYNERKNIEGTLDAFALANTHFNKPVYLCLHTPGIHAEKLKILIDLIKQNPAADHIILNPLGGQYIPEEALAELYQICEIGINTSYGEGWGLIAYEHAACGGAQIVPGHTTPLCEWEGITAVIPATNKVHLNGNPYVMKNIQAKELISVMIKLVNNDHYRRQIQQRCMSHTKKAKYNWQTIAEEWMKVFT